jgi:hypothetical protein
MINYHQEDKMKFHYYLYGNAGWAGLIFENKNVSLKYQISYRGHCLNQLLSGILGISGSEILIHSIEYYHPDLIFDKDRFEWNIDQEGPDGSVKFIFNKIDDSDIINLKIIEIDDDDKEKCVYNDNINLTNLLENILFSCSEILRKYGIIGYSLNFWNDFPIVYYLILKDFKKNEIKIDSFTEIINKEKHMFRSDLSKEVEYINGVN